VDDKNNSMFQENGDGNGHLRGNGDVSEMAGTRDPVELRE